MSETENGRLALYGTEHSKCNHLMTVHFKGLTPCQVAEFADTCKSKHNCALLTVSGLNHKRPDIKQNSQQHYNAHNVTTHKCIIHTSLLKI